MPRSVLLVVVAMVPRVPVVLVSVVVGHAAYIDDAVGGQRGDDRRVRIQQDASKVDAAENGGMGAAWQWQLVAFAPSLFRPSLGVDAGGEGSPPRAW